MLYVTHIGETRRRPRHRHGDRQPERPATLPMRPRRQGRAWQGVPGAARVKTAIFVVTMIVLTAARIAWADVQTTWSCSKVKDKKVCTFEITIQGEIVPATLEGVKKALVERQEMMAREGGWSDLWIVHLDSPGGSVQAAFDIGRLLRSASAAVDIGPDKQCVSACVLILAGATGRLINGRVGIHRPYFQTPNGAVGFNDVQKAYSNMTERIRAYLREMNVSDRLADDMMIVPPERVLNEAKKLGIDRREYMRRNALSSTLCKLAPASPGAWSLISQACSDAVLAGKRVEKAPPCPNEVATCHPWEREWNGRPAAAGDVVSDDGFIISTGK